MKNQPEHWLGPVRSAASPPHSDRPFCSKRCADVDLHRWLGGVYVIPASHESDPEPDAAKISEP
jgi:endogenous inhibitor of DNA gyrase (YacG/DUF329 family)